MNDESRNKNKIYELISKNRLLFALAGIIVAVIAFFMPMFHDVSSLFIYGLFRRVTYEGDVDLYWLSDYPNESTSAAISLISTSIAGFFVVASIFIASFVLIRKRKKGEESSRLILLCSFGFLATVVAYLLAMDCNAFESTSLTDWVGGNLYAWSIPIGMGAILFVVSSCLMLAGHTLKARPLLRLFSLVVAVLVCYNSVLYLQRFLYYESSWISTPPPDVLLGNLTEHLVPGIVLLSVTLVITVVNLIIQLKVRKKRKIDSLE